MTIIEKYIKIYSKIYSKIKELGEALDGLKPTLMLQLEELGGKYEGDDATISTTATKEYKFSKAVDEKELEVKIKQAELKATKDYEIKTNKAKCIETKYSPRVTLKKDK